MTKKQFALGAVMAAAALCLTSAETQAQESPPAEPSQVPSGHCTRPFEDSRLENPAWQNATTQEAIALRCRSVAERQRGLEAALARFYSGRAYNRAGDQGDEAIRQLELAVNLGQEIVRQFGPELFVARRELVQAYRVAGRRNAAEELLRGLPTSDAGVAYQRAMLMLGELGAPGREQAFDALRTAFFGRDDDELLWSPRAPTGLTGTEVQRARSWLFWLGMALGDDVLRQEGATADQSRADAVRAIAFYSAAADVVERACPSRQRVEDCGNIGGTEQIGGLQTHAAPTAEQLLNAFARLGDANLQAAGVPKMAGLSVETTGNALGARDCFVAPREAGPYPQNARGAFQTVIERSPQGTRVLEEARWGRFCTILVDIGGTGNSPQGGQLDAAMEDLGGTRNPLILITLARVQLLRGDLSGARSSYETAIGQSGQSAVCPAAERRDANAEIPSRIYLELARTYLSEPLAADRRSESDLFGRTITDITTARPEALRAPEVERYLKCAVYLSSNNSEARLTLGHLYLRLGSMGDLDPPPFLQATAVLAYFRQPRGSDPAVPAEGLFLLSRRETLLQQNRILNGGGALGNGDNAVSNAIQAYNMSQRPEFRQQACMAQMVFGRGLDVDVFCSASGEGAEYVESLLFEGMYWLRRGQSERGALRMRNWSRAIQLFNRGLADPYADRPIRALVHPSLTTQTSMTQLLQYGERYVLRCSGLGYSDPARASEDVRNFFRLSGMPDPCGGDPR